MDWTVYLELAIATGLGLLVGLQREWMQKEPPASLPLCDYITGEAMLLCQWQGKIVEYG